MNPPAPDPCRIDWIEIPAPDLEGAVQFYTSIFGWTTEPYSDDYAIFTSGTLRGGLSRSASAWASSSQANRSGHGIKISITVADIESTLQRITEAGGRIVRTKYEIGPGLGFSAMFRDPNGNVLDLFSDA